MSSGPKSRSSRGPTSPRGIYTKSVRAPGVSLDMPDGEPVKKRVGGKIKKYSMGGAMARKGAGAAQKGAQQGAQAVNPRYGKTSQEPYNEKDLGYSGVSKDPVFPDPVKYPEYIEEVGEERVSGPRMRKGGVARSSASKRADGCAVRGKTRGKMV